MHIKVWSTNKAPWTWQNLNSLYHSEFLREWIVRIFQVKEVIDTNSLVEEIHFSTKVDLVFLVIPRYVLLNKWIIWLYLVGFCLRNYFKMCIDLNTALCGRVGSNFDSHSGVQRLVHKSLLRYQYYSIPYLFFLLSASVTVSRHTPWHRRSVAVFSPQKHGLNPRADTVERLVARVKLWQIFLKMLRVSIFNVIAPTRDFLVLIIFRLHYITSGTDGVLNLCI
jgi:hypothetical protein